MDNNHKVKRGERKVSPFNMESKILIDVGCAVIHREAELLITRRHLNDSFGGLWEFPGGKREGTETIEECLIREIGEELGIEIAPEKEFFKKEIITPQKKLILHFYFCKWASGTPRLIDCLDAKWISRDQISKYTFLPGDKEVLADLKMNWNKYFS